MSREKKSTFEQRVDWLVKNFDQWIDWFPELACVDFFLPFEKYLNHVPLRKRNIILSMKQAGLFSESTYWKDVKLYHELVSALKIVRSKS